MQLKSSSPDHNRCERPLLFGERHGAQSQDGDSAGRGERDVEKDDESGLGGLEREIEQTEDQERALAETLGH